MSNKSSLESQLEYIFSILKKNNKNYPTLYLRNEHNQYCLTQRKDDGGYQELIRWCDAKEMSLFLTGILTGLFLFGDVK